MHVLAEFGVASAPLAQACLKQMLSNVAHSARQRHVLCQLGALPGVLVRFLHAVPSEAEAHAAAVGMGATLLGILEPGATCAAGGLQALTAAMDGWPGDAQVAACACAALCTMAQGSRRRAVDAGCGRAAVRALELLKPAEAEGVEVCGAAGSAAGGGDATASAHRAAAKLLKLLGRDMDGTQSDCEHNCCVLVREGAVGTLARYLSRYPGDRGGPTEEAKGAAQAAMVAICMWADGHFLTEQRHAEQTPAMRTLGVEDPNYSVTLALEAGCPRQIFREIGFVQDMMRADGDPEADNCLRTQPRRVDREPGGRDARASPSTRPAAPPSRRATDAGSAEELVRAMGML